MSSARIEELRKKFDENPRRYFAPLANEYRKVGDFDQAIFICQEYLPQQPGHMSGHIVFGQALFEANRLPEAKTVFETALSLDPENLIALRHLADISRDLGDTTAAKGWYERVLQADPRNEEVVAIVAQLGSSPATPALASAVPSAAEAPSQTAAADQAAAAPTVELSAEAVQELLKARQAARPTADPKRDTLPEPMNLDTTPTVEIRVGETSTMEGLEPTSHGGTVEMSAIEPLGVETNAAPGLQAESPAPIPLDGLDTIQVDVASRPSAPPPEPPVAATAEIPAESNAEDGMLDLGSFSIGGGIAGAPSPEPASTAETPIDGGHEGTDLIDLDFDAPVTAAAEPPSVPPSLPVPTMILDVMKTVVPAMQSAVESAAPGMMDLVDTTIPAVVGTVKSAMEAVAEMPTVIIQAIKAPTSTDAAGSGAPPATPAPERPSQSIPFVTETMAQLYLSQGHRAEAIDIYRKLIEARPNDGELKSRLAAIENAAAAMSAASQMGTAPSPSTVPASPSRRFSGTGPSIRTVLRELFGFDASATYATAAPAFTATVPAEVGSIDMLFSTESVTDGLNPLAVAFDGGYVAGQGSIDDLFAGAR